MCSAVVWESWQHENSCLSLMKRYWMLIYNILFILHQSHPSDMQLRDSIRLCFFSGTFLFSSLQSLFSQTTRITFYLYLYGLYSKISSDFNGYALWKLGNSNAAMCYTAGSRGVDENNEDYPSKDVRSNNNVLNLAQPRKRVPKVTPNGLNLKIHSFGISFINIQYVIVKLVIQGILLNKHMRFC